MGSTLSLLLLLTTPPPAYARVPDWVREYEARYAARARIPSFSRQTGLACNVCHTAFPMLTAFDAPESNVTCTRRDRSNSALLSFNLNRAREFGIALVVVFEVVEHRR